MHRTLLIPFVVYSTFSFSQTHKITPPVNDSLLKVNKIKSINIYYETEGVKEQQPFATYKLENGLITNEKLSANGKPSAERKVEYNRDNTIYQLFIAEGGNMKLMEKVVEDFNPDKKIIQRRHTKNYGKYEETIEKFKPGNLTYKYKISTIVSGKDTTIISNTRETPDKEIHLIKTKTNDKWTETEKAITIYKKNVATDYKLYKEGKLHYEWNINDKKNTSDNIENDRMNNPLPHYEKEPRADTLYSSDGNIVNAVKNKSKNSYMVVHQYGSYAYENKILTTTVYYPNGLPYSIHNTAEKRKKIFEYNN